MWTSLDAFESDACPVRDDLLGALYRADAEGLPKLVESVSAEARAMLALFCYRRSHLHGLAIAIAASCEARDLIRIGGRVGATLHALTEDKPAVRAVTTHGGRKAITLSTKPLSTLPPLHDDLDDDFAEPAVA